MLIDSIIKAICSCFNGEKTDFHVQLQILKALLALVNSPSCSIHAKNQRKIIRTCINIYLATSKLPTVQTTAKATLTQMLNVVFHKIETDPFLFSQAQSRMDVSLRIPLNPLNDKKTINSVQLTSEDDNIEHNLIPTTTEYQELPQQINPETIQFPEISKNEDHSNVLQFPSSISCENVDQNTLLSHSPKELPDQSQSDSVKDIRTLDIDDDDDDDDDDDAPIGISYIDQSKLPDNESITVDVHSFNDSPYVPPLNETSQDFPVIKTETDLQILVTQSSQSISDRESSPDLERVEISKLYLKDAADLFYMLCTISDKQLADLHSPRSYEIRLKVILLEMILIVLDNSGPVFRTDSTIIKIVREYLCQSLSINVISPVLEVFELAITIFLVVVGLFKTFLKAQIEVFFNEIIFNILDSQTSSYEHKWIVLHTLTKICSDSQLILDLYINYDCDLAYVNVYEMLISVLTRTSKSSNLVKIGIISTTQERELKLKALECLVLILRCLVEWSRELYFNPNQEYGDLNMLQNAPIPYKHDVDLYLRTVLSKRVEGVPRRSGSHNTLPHLSLSGNLKI